MPIYPAYIPCGRKRPGAAIKYGSKDAASCKITVENPDNAPPTPQAGPNYLPARLAGVFTWDFCESRCTLGSRVCNGNRFGPPENVTETA